LRKIISIQINNRRMFKNIIGVLFFSFLLVMTSFTNLNLKQYKVKKVVIDAGHGGKDPGTSGKSVREKDIALKVALEVGRLIKKNMPEVQVIYTRKNDTFIELNNRANIANTNNADLFISIHCNSNPNHKIKGTETYIMGLEKSNANLEVAKRENEVILLEEDHETVYEGFDPKSAQSHIIFSLYQNAYRTNSIKIAEKVESEFKNKSKRHSRGVKQQGFLVLWRTSMPSILIELGFLTNPEEEKYLKDELGQSYLASSVFRAFKDYKEELETVN
jgi:N-acetylmuramoyl-L-alanine amidase